jgi:hypothetical protein
MVGEANTVGVDPTCIDYPVRELPSIVIQRTVRQLIEAYHQLNKAQDLLASIIQGQLSGKLLVAENSGFNGRPLKARELFGLSSTPFVIPQLRTMRIISVSMYGRREVFVVSVSVGWGSGRNEPDEKR